MKILHYAIWTILAAHHISYKIYQRRLLKKLIDEFKQFPIALNHIIKDYLSGQYYYLIDQSCNGFDDWEEDLTNYLKFSKTCNYKSNNDEDGILDSDKGKIQLLLAVSRWNHQNIKSNQHNLDENHYKLKGILNDRIFIGERNERGIERSEMIEFTDRVNVELCKPVMMEELLLEDWMENREMIKKRLRNGLMNGIEEEGHSTNFNIDQNEKSKIEIDPYILDLNAITSNSYIYSFLNYNNDLLRIMTNGKKLENWKLSDTMENFEALWAEREKRWLLSMFKRVKLAKNLWTLKMMSLFEKLENFNPNKISKIQFIIYSVDLNEKIDKIMEKKQTKSKSKLKRQRQKRVKGNKCCHKRAIEFISELFKKFHLN